MADVLCYTSYLCAFSAHKTLDLQLQVGKILLVLKRLKIRNNSYLIKWFQIREADPSDIIGTYFRISE